MTKHIITSLMLVSVFACSSKNVIIEEGRHQKVADTQEKFVNNDQQTTNKTYLVDGQTQSAQVIQVDNISGESLMLATDLKSEDLSKQLNKNKFNKIVNAKNTSPIIFYFDYDSVNLSQEIINQLIVYAKKMQNNPVLKLRLEGHSDERGSRSYNLALGENRALAIKQVFALYAVESRVDAVSYGEENPIDDRHNESAWEKNRRVELIFY